MGDQPRTKRFPGASSQSIAQHLITLAQRRPQSLTVRELIDRYAGPVRRPGLHPQQRLSAWQAMIEFTWNRWTRISYAGRSSSQPSRPWSSWAWTMRTPNLQGQGRAKTKSTATLNRYMVAIAAVVFTWAIGATSDPRRPGCTHAAASSVCRKTMAGCASWTPTNAPNFVRGLQSLSSTSPSAMALMAMKTGARREQTAELDLEGC